MQFDIYSGKQVLAEELLNLVNKITLRNGLQSKQKVFNLLKRTLSQCSSSEETNDLEISSQVLKSLPMFVFALEELLQRSNFNHVGYVFECLVINSLELSYKEELSHTLNSKNTKSSGSLKIDSILGKLDSSGMKEMRMMVSAIKEVEEVDHDFSDEDGSDGKFAHMKFEKSGFSGEE